MPVTRLVCCGRHPVIFPGVGERDRHSRCGPGTLAGFRRLWLYSQPWRNHLQQHRQPMRGDVVRGIQIRVELAALAFRVQASERCQLRVFLAARNLPEPSNAQREVPRAWIASIRIQSSPALVVTHLISMRCWKRWKRWRIGLPGSFGRPPSDPRPRSPARRVPSPTRRSRH